MCPPPKFHSTSTNWVCRLKKSLYGLCQAPRYWFSKHTTALHKYDSSQSYCDYSLFTYNKNVIFYVFLYIWISLVIHSHLSSS